jgi:hypothetical protein
MSMPGWSVAIPFRKHCKMFHLDDVYIIKHSGYRTNPVLSITIFESDFYFLKAIEIRLGISMIISDRISDA